ncbi:MAG: sulfur oxidation c-type cytochrome SoxX [Acidiferrobacterales bacterium]
MRKTARIILGATAAVLLAGAGAMTPAAAAGHVPTSAECSNKAHPPTDPAVIGGCIAISPKLGNCIACHAIAGAVEPGNIGPRLVDIAGRFPDRAKLHAQIWDPTAANPQSVMPPYGRNKILTGKQINEVVDFLETL